MSADPQKLINDLVLYFIPTILSLSLHEWGHAWSAVALGDQTPREQGRLTVNPVVHIDLLGTIIVPLVMIFAGQPPFGWAKPVQITPYRFTRKVKMKTGLMLTSAAGPFMNLVLAVAAALLLAASDHTLHLPGGERTVNLLAETLRINVVLFLFNLIPVPPLDGSRVLGGLMPHSMRAGYTQLERFSPVFLGVLFFTGVGGALITKPAGALMLGLDHFAHLLFS